MEFSGMTGEERLADEEVEVRRSWTPAGLGLNARNIY
jgi:hypothetical protein